MEQKRFGIPFLKDSLNLLLIRLTITLANLFVFAYYSHQLSVEDNGDYLNFYIRVSMLSVVACAGITLFIYSYSIKTIKAIWQNLKPRYLLSYIFFTILISALLLWLHFKGGENIISFFYSLTLLVYFITFSLNLITDALITVGKKERWLVVVNLCYSVAFVAIHVGVFLTGYALSRVIGWLAIISLAKLLFNTVQSHQILKQTDTSDAPVISSGRIKKYWSNIFFYDISQVVFRLLDKFFVSIILVSTLSAIYINGTLDIPFIPLIFAALGNTFLIQLNTQNNRNNADIAASVRYTSRLMATVVIPSFLFLFIFRKEFIFFFFSDKYLQSVPIFGIGLFKILTYLATVPFIFQIKQKGIMLNVGVFIDVVFSLGLLYPLFSFFGLEGIIASFVIGTLLQTAYYTVQSAKLLHTKFYHLLPLKNIALKLILYTAVLVPIYEFIRPIESDFIKLIIPGCLVFLIAGIIFYFEFFREERSIVG